MFALLSHLTNEGDNAINKANGRAVRSCGAVT